MAVSTEDLKVQQGAEAELAPPDAQGGKAKVHTYNYPFRYYKRPDDTEPCGFSIIRGPGDPDAYMRYVSSPEEGGLGWQYLAPSVGKREWEAQAARRIKRAKEINAEREKEKQEKNHPTFVVPAPQPTERGVTLTPDEYEAFKAFMAEKAIAEGDAGRKGYSKACEVCDESFDSPLKLANHRRSKHAQG